MFGLVSLLLSVGMGMGIFYNPPQPPVATPHVIAPAPGIGVPLNTYQLKLITDVDWIPLPPLPTLNVKRTWQTTDALGLVMPENTYQVAQIGLWWTIPPPLPTLDVKLTPPSVDLPPFYRNAHVNPIAVAWIPPPPPPTLNVKLTPPTGVDQPPIGRRWEQIAIYGDPAPPLPTLGAKFPQSPPLILVTIAWNTYQIQAITQDWIPAPPLPALNVPLVQPSTGDQPAPNSRTPFWTIGAAWLPIAGLPPTLTPIVPSPLLLVSIPFNAYQLQTITQAWIAGPPLPALPVLLTPPSGVDALIPSNSYQMSAIAGLWIPAAPMPPRGIQSIPSYVIVPTTAPKLILVDGRLALHLSGMLYTVLD